MGDEAVAAIDAGHTQHSDEGRQCERQSEKPQDKAASGKMRFRMEGAGNGDREGDRKQAGCDGLCDGETGGSPEIGIEICGGIEAAAGLKGKCDERTTGQHGKESQRQSPRDGFHRGGGVGSFACRSVYHLLVAASHSSTQALRFFATSSDGMSKVFSGFGKASNAAGNGVEVLPAGNIQLVSGITS